MICFGRRVSLSWLAGSRSQFDGEFWGLAIGQTFIGVWRRVERVREPADPMRIIGHTKVAENVYDVTSESKRYGRVTRRVLVIPEGAMLRSARPRPESGPAAREEPKR